MPAPSERETDGSLLVVTHCEGCFELEFVDGASSRAHQLPDRYFTSQLVE